MADYHHNADNLPEHVKKSCNGMKILKKVSAIVIVDDHASTMGALCEQLNKDFHGCFNHFLNLVCKLLLSASKKANVYVNLFVTTIR